MSFRTPLDIANLALVEGLGQRRIESFDEDNQRASETNFAYDKLRRVELRNHLWKFSTRRTVLRPINDTDMLLQPALWQSVVEYRPGALVTDEAGTVWINNTPRNLNQAPGGFYYWDCYTGPMTAQPWDEDETYSAGEVVYKYPGDGTYKVYMSLVDSNDDDPATATAWSATITYNKDAIVQHSAVSYISLIDLNLNQTPSTTPAAWSAATTYAAGNQVYGSDGYVYTSIGSDNAGNNPVTTSGFWTNTGVLKPWTNTFTGGTGSAKWRELLNVALTDLFTPYPIGAGPSTNAASRNAFRLPANFLRVASQNPKQGSVSVLGAPAGMAYSDWLFEGDYFTSRTVDPIIFRFVADLQTVPQMDDKFCEALAARIAVATCEPITGSTDKKSVALQMYNKAIRDAQLVNAIESGAVEPAVDDYIATRM